MPATNLNRMAFALWNFGRSNSTDQQAAMMLYVHGLMGDARPGEVDPSVLGSGVQASYGQIASAAARYAGPYSIQESLPASTGVGSKVQVQLAVRAASGADVPGVNFTVSETGGSGPSDVTSNGSGVAGFTVSAGQPGPLTVAATANGLASALPELYVPTHGAAAASGQRLVVPASATVTTHATSNVSLARLTLTTTATPSTLTLGQTDADSVTLAGAPAGDRPEIQIDAYGPAASAAAVSCSGTPAAHATFTAADGTARAPTFTPTAPGYYGYQLTIAATARVSGVTTACGGSGETFAVFAAPAVHTVVSAATVTAGSALSDTVTVSGLGDQPATVSASLYGPYPSATKMTCTGPPVWTGSIPVQADGQYQTAPVTLTVPGYYVYVESIAAAGFVRAATTGCSIASETTLVPGAPTVTTQVSAATTAPGSQISDQVVVAGLGALGATINVSLYGPYASTKAIDCAGTPVSTNTVTANGNGTYTSPKVTLPSAGYYTFHETIAAAPTYPAVDTPCAGGERDDLRQGGPALQTTASSAVVRPGSALLITSPSPGLARRRRRSPSTCSGRMRRSPRSTVAGPRSQCAA